MTIILALLAVLVTVATTRAEIHETDYKQMVGTLNVLAICVQTSDAANTTTYTTQSSAMALVQSRTLQSSYNRLTLNYTVAPNVLMLPQTAYYYNHINSPETRFETLRVDCATAAQQAGYDISPTDYLSYDRLVVNLPSAIRIKERVYTQYSTTTPSPLQSCTSWVTAI